MNTCHNQFGKSQILKEKCERKIKYLSSEPCKSKNAMSFNVTVMCGPKFGGTFLRIRFAIFFWLKSLSSIQKKINDESFKEYLFRIYYNSLDLVLQKCNIYFKTIWRTVSIRALSGDLNVELEVPQGSNLFGPVLFQFT